jgi:hypothetical protein
MNLDRRAAILCAVIAVIAALLTYPLLETGVSDDFSYNLTARVFAETGHYIYNGWATAMLGVQIWWAALFIKVFGFSFTLVRLSMFPFTAGCAVLLYYMGRHAELNPKLSVFFSLFTVISPFFITLVPSFMTDICGMFFLLASLFSFSRGVDALENPEGGNTKRALALLAFGALLGLMGGTVRQIIWLVPLASLFYVAVARPGKNATVQRLSPVLLVVTAGLVVLCDRWFKMQPYSVPQDLGKTAQNVLHAEWFRMPFSVTSFSMTTLLHLMPILACTLPALLRKEWGIKAQPQTQRRVLATLLVISAGAALMVWVGAKMNITPYWQTTVTTSGAHYWCLLTPQPRTMPKVVSLGLLGISVACALILGFVSARRVPTDKSLVSGLLAGFMAQPSIIRLMITYLIPYIAVVIFVSTTQGPVDRYVMPLLPLVALLLLRGYQPIRPSASLLGWGVLSIYALYGVAIMHEYFSDARQRLHATQIMAAAGVPRTEVFVGFDQDAWFQITEQGYLNEPRVKVPAGVFHPVSFKSLPFEPPGNDRLSVFNPRYYVVSQRQEMLVDDPRFQPITFGSLFPPFSRTLYIQTLPQQEPQTP